MIVGAELVAETAAKVLERIAEDDGELAEVDEVFVIVAVHYGRAEDEDADYGTTFYRCTSARLHVQLGLLVQARRAIERTTADPLGSDEGES